MFQAAIETLLTFRQPDNITTQTTVTPMEAREFNVYVIISFCLHFTSSETGVINSLEDLCIMQVVTVNSFA